MSGEARREKIIEILEQEKDSLSGTEIARRVGVSRQVIVQDIALLRTTHKNIISTSRGYLLYKDPERTGWHKKVIKVKHSKADIMRELDCVVDAGGRVLDVIVEHEIYGQLTGSLVIRNRADVREFIRKVEEHQSRPLTDLTEGVHFHTIEAEQVETLDAVEQALAEEGFLCE